MHAGAARLCDHQNAVKTLRILWALPTTVVGLVIATLAVRGGRVRIVDGAIEASGPLIRWVLTACVPIRGAAAMTLGHVVIGCDEAALESSRAHERVHVRQYELWGPLFVPAYLAASAYAFLRGGHYYHDNAFERQACALSGEPEAQRERGSTSLRQSGQMP